MFTRFIFRRGPESPRDRNLASTPSGELTVRMAGGSDEAAITRLAALDSARVPAGQLLVAEVGGSIEAAMPLAGGRAIANPFVPSADLIKLLELRAAQLGELPERAPSLRLVERTA